MGRERTIKWGPRNIDIDILLAEYGGAKSDLNLPHRFTTVLSRSSSSELVPEALHPLENKTIAELLSRLDTGE